jgi:hypothetical protein
MSGGFLIAATDTGPHASFLTGIASISQIGISLPKCAL